MTPFDCPPAAGAQDDRSCFAAGARRLAGITGRALGWRPAEFWAATPAELAAILSGEDAQTTAPLGRAELEALMEREHHG